VADVDGAIAVGGDVEGAQRAGDGLDDRAPVAVAEPCKEALMVRMTAQILALRGAGVEVAVALAIAQEPDAPLGNDRAHHPRDLLGQQALPAALTGEVDPELARLAAAIALPARQI